MRLVKFSVTNFRSITKAHEISLSSTTVLVGKNNEGKSNLLKALAFAMHEIAMHSRYERHHMPPRHMRTRMPYQPRYAERDSYDWHRDFPIALQCRKGKRQTRFKLEFELSDEDTRSFKNEIGSNLNGTLPLEITIGENNNAIIKVVKRGRGSKLLNSKSGPITNFVASRIFFNYIPAVRTHKETLSALEDIVSRELSRLEDKQEYQRALKAISDLQKPVLEELATKIKAPLSEFLPNIQNVEIKVDEDSRRFRYRRDFNVIIDDGVATSIEYKGDGVKSLAALGLLKNRSFKGSVSIVAIEEPESHLHPGAIHQLKDIITSLEGENQIVLTTHNPLFVNRAIIKSNIIVDGSKATPAKNIAGVRDVLGVRVSDNLVNARYALVVEGNEDKVALRALLPKLSTKLAHALKNHLLVIDPISGAGNLAYKLSTLESQLCVYHVLLDNDEAANKEKERAEGQGLLKAKNLTQTVCNGMAESEFEDCIDSSCFKDALLTQYGVDITCSEFRGSKKWSERMRAVCSSQGKVWNDKLKFQIKETVAQCIAIHPESALQNNKRHSIDALVRALEELVNIAA